jgi:hypothetical protein
MKIYEVKFAKDKKRNQSRFAQVPFTPTNQRRSASFKSFPSLLLVFPETMFFFGCGWSGERKRRKIKNETLEQAPM